MSHLGPSFSDSNPSGGGGGGATAANQVLEIALLTSIDGKFNSLGQKPMAGSVPVVIASDQSSIPVAATQSGTWTVQQGTPPWDVTVSSSALPTGAATEATLSALNAKFNSLGQKTMAASAPVVIASDQSTIPVSVASLPLPSGAATEATLSALNAKFNSLGQKTMANSAPVVLASDQSAIPVTQSGAWSVSVSSSALPTGASTEATLSALNAKFNSLGQKTMANSAPVVLASDQSAIPVTQSGTWTVQQGTPPWQVVGNVASAATDSGNPVKTGAVFNTTQPTVSNGQRVDAQATARGALIVATGADTFNVAVSSAALPTGAATEATLAALNAKFNSLGQKTMANSAPVVIASDQSSIPVAATQSGTWTVQQGTPPWSVAGNVASGAADSGNPVKTGGPFNTTQPTVTNGQRVDTQHTARGAVIVAAGVEPFNTVVTSAALPTGAATEATLAALSAKFNSLGQKTMANSAPVVLASDQSAIPVTQSGTWTVQQGTPPWQVSGNVASAATDSGNPVKIGAVFNTTLPTVTNGQRVDLQADANGRLLSASVPVDGSKLTYASAIAGLALAAAATDVFTLTGSASKTIRIHEISITGSATAAAFANISIIKRSTANTAGTSTTPAVVPHDSANAAGTAVARAYTANPTLGTTVGTIKSTRMLFDSTTIVSTAYVWQQGSNPCQAIVLRGTSEVLAINMNGVTFTTGVVNIHIVWTEE